MVDRRAKHTFVKDLDNAMEEAIKNTICLYPGCSNPPINSHVIPRKMLKVIAGGSHVLTWVITPTWDMIHTLDAGKSLEQLNQEPVAVGIGDKRKVTDPLFCQEHDGKIFVSLEQQEFSFQPEQVLLLAYRASCTLTASSASLEKAILKVARKYGYLHSLDTPEQLQKYERIQAVKCILEARQRYTQMYQSQDYSQLGYTIHLVPIPPCIAATYTLIPVNNTDVLAIVNGTQLFTPEDVVSFSFLPYLPLNSSICIISWLRGSERAKHFMTLNRINELVEKEQQDLFLNFAFESPNLYISPVWWNTLSEAKREEYKQTHLNIGKNMQN